MILAVLILAFFTFAFVVLLRDLDTLIAQVEHDELVDALWADETRSVPFRASSSDRGQVASTTDGTDYFGDAA